MREHPMIHPSIRNLYLYRAPDQGTDAYVASIFETRKLWASIPEKFNDPFDCDLEITSSVTESEYLRAVAEEYGDRDLWPGELRDYVTANIDAQGVFSLAERARIDGVVKSFVEENRNSGVVCLSELNDSILMWAHYARPARIKVC